MTGYRLREELAAREKEKPGEDRGGRRRLSRPGSGQPDQPDARFTCCSPGCPPPGTGRGRPQPDRQNRQIPALSRSGEPAEGHWPWEIGVVTDPCAGRADLDIVVDCTGDPETGAALATPSSAGRSFIANPETDATAGAASKPWLTRPASSTAAPTATNPG